MKSRGKFEKWPRPEKKIRSILKDPQGPYYLSRFSLKLS
jgi:hypothetical protein